MTTMGWLAAVGVAVTLVACGSGDPCTELCDGIARCREGNATCVAAGMSAADPFMSTCVAQCESSASLLTSPQEQQALDCLDCLRGQTNFDACVGETLLDTMCAATCRSEGAGEFRNDFGPALFSEFGCLAEPRP